MNREFAKEDVLKLRWAIVAGGYVVMVCKSKARAEGIVLFAREDTPKNSLAWPIEILDLFEPIPKKKK